MSWWKKTLKFVWKNVGKPALEAELPLALEIVTQLAPLQWSNDQKRQDAFKRIKDKLRRRGLELKDREINLLIELAVNQLKSAEGK